VNALVVTLHILACITLVVLVLLQSGKEGMGVIFGGGSASLFGASGAGGILGKLTAGAAIVFFLTTITFTYMSAQQHIKPKASVVLEAPIPVEPQAASPAPAAPAAQ